MNRWSFYFEKWRQTPKWSCKYFSGSPIVEPCRLFYDLMVDLLKDAFWTDIFWRHYLWRSSAKPRDTTSRLLAFNLYWNHFSQLCRTPASLSMVTSPYFFITTSPISTWTLFEFRITFLCTDTHPKNMVRSTNKNETRPKRLDPTIFLFDNSCFTWIVFKQSHRQSNLRF